MSLQIFDNLEQGSGAWHDARRGIITASVVGQFITPKTIKPAANDKTLRMAFQLVAERITGHTEPNYVSADMEEGHFIEPFARALYSETYAPVTQVGFMTNDIAGHTVGFSPDGLVGDDGLIEIKSHKPKLHLAIILADEIPAEHMAQCQTGLLVSGRQWLDYISWCGGMPMWTKRVLPDPRWHEAITETVATLEVFAAGMIIAYHAATVGLPATERTDRFGEMVF